MEYQTHNNPSKWSQVKPLLVGVLLGTLTGLFPLALLFVPAFWASVALRGRFSTLLLFMAAFLAGTLTLYTPYTAITLTLLCGLPAIILYVFVPKKMDHVTVMAIIAGVGILLLYAALCLPGILSGEGAFSRIQAYIDLAVEGSRGAMSGMPGAAPELIAAYEGYLDMLGDAAALITMPALCACGVALGLGNYLFFRRFTRKGGYDFLLMRPFRLWAIPPAFTLGICLFLIGSFALDLMELPYAAALSATVTVLVGTPLIIQGLALIDFTIVRKGKRIKLRRIVIYTLAGLFFSLLQMPLMLTGCMEQLLHIRDRYNALPPTGPADG